MKVITIPYKPRPLWKDVIHPALDKYRFAVIVAHRRYGKTVGMINELSKSAIKNTLISPQFAYVAPFRNQAKMIAWNYLKYYTSAIPGRKVNESDLFIELPSKHKNAVGARIYIIGADKPDALRGTYWDGVVLDEYAQIKPELWGEVIRPALADRKGFAYFIGTPKGQNQFYEIYQKAQRSEEWFTCLYRADESGVLDEAELKSMMKDMTKIEIRQELYCDFTASASEVVIPIDLVTEAAHRTLVSRDVIGMPTVLGVDVARYGDDSTVIFARQGLMLHKPRVYRELNVTEVVDRVILAIADYRPEIVFIDVGNMGAGVIDRLRQLGYDNVYEVAFGSNAMEHNRFENIRAEMYFKARDWLLSGGAIPDIPEFKSELSVVEYKFSDKTSRIMLKPKKEIKEKLGRSPDLADAFVLTFARPLYVPIDTDDVRQQSYDPFAGM